MSDTTNKIRTVEVALPKRSYPIVIGSGVRRKFGELFSQHGRGRSFWVTDRNVADLWGQDLKGTAAKGSSACGAPTRELIVLRPGEDQKKLSTVEELCRKLIVSGAERGDTLVACGGGVVGDIVGFTAASYLRGIALVQAPTTLLAMVDASVGGKTGVDLPEGKNLVGAFHQPHFVLIDVDFLSTLPRREMLSGMAEVVKTALIGDPELFARLRRSRKPSFENSTFLMDIIEACLKFKSGIVVRDEIELDLRRILNFGHTIGHALEALGNYQALKHGEAVFWGMWAAVNLSHQLGYLDQQTRAEINLLLGPYLDEIPAPSFSAEKVLDFLARDKKVRRGSAHFVLLKGIGQPFVTHEVNRAAIIESLEQLRQKQKA